MKLPDDINTVPNNTITKFLTVNVNGLNNFNKRDKIFNLLKTKKIDLALLQETHSTKTTETQWQKEWTGMAFWNSGPTHQSAGVSILFTEKFEGKIQNIIKGCVHYIFASLV